MSNTHTHSFDVRLDITTEGSAFGNHKIEDTHVHSIVYDKLNDCIENEGEVMKIKTDSGHGEAVVYVTTTITDRREG